MKQLLFLVVVSSIGVVGALVQPFYGVFVYYIYSILRPQWLWAWALPGKVRWSLIVALAALVGVALSLPRTIAQLRWNLTATLICLFGVCVLLSTITALDPHTAHGWAQEYAKVLLMAIVLITTMHQPHYIKWLCWMVLIVIGYIAWELNARYLFDGRLTIYHHGFCGFDNNGAALMLALGVPFAYGVWRSSNSLFVQGACIFAGLCMVHGIMLSYSRGAMLSVSVGVCWLAIHHRPRIQVPFLAVGIVVTVLALAGAEVRARFSSITEYEHDPSAQSRLDGWRAGWEMAWDRPWFGVGARNTNLYLDRYGADVEGRTIHNQFLQMGASFGIPAMLVYLGVCATAFFSTRQVWTMTGAGRTDYQPGAPPIQAVQPDSPVLFYDRQWSYLALGIEGSLVIFLFGSIFLSLGVFELPWLLIAMAGSMPQLVREDLRHRLVHSNPKAESRSSQGHTCPAPSPVETNP